MVTIEIDNEQLHTDEDFSVSIEDQNPATVFDEIPGAKALDIEIPINDTNRIKLDQPDRFEKMGSVNDRSFANASLRHLGQIIQKGTLVIDDTDGSYSGYLYDAIGTLIEEFSDKYVNESTLGGTKNFANKTNYDPDADDYACPKIFNRSFWYDRGSSTSKTVVKQDLEGNEYNSEEEDGKLTWQFYDNESFLVNFPTDLGVKVSGEDTGHVVSPMLFLWRAVELILSDYNVFVTENFLKDQESLKKLIVYNSFSITKSVIEYDQTIFSDFTYEEIMYGMTSGRKITKVTSVADEFSYGDLLPEVYIGKWLLGIRKLLNVTFSINDLNECRIADAQRLLTDKAYDVDDYIVGGWTMGERKDVCIKLGMTHDSNDSAFSDNYTDLSDIRDNIEEPVDQLSDLDDLDPELDEIRKVSALNAFYQYHWYVATIAADDGSEEEVDILGWEKISICFQPYYYNDGDRDIEPITSCFSTLVQSDNGYPLAMQQGNSEYFKTQAVDFSPRLLFYLGDEAASFRDSAMSLDFADDNGLAATRWNYTLPFWANRLPAKATFKFPASVYYYIKNNKDILPLKTRYGSFIIDSMTATAGNPDTIEVEIAAFKRESISDAESGTVDGSGDGTASTFTPVYVGVNASGKPYLVNAEGDVRIAPAWGTLSSFTYAKSTCVDYDATNKLLFTGGYNGMLYITDLSDVDNIKMKGVKVFTSGNLSAVRYVNGVLLIASEDSSETYQIYQQPYHAALADYTDYESTATGVYTSGHIACDFVYVNSVYYACSREGEIHKSTDLSNAWTEIKDVSAHFTHMVETDNYVWVLEDDDRNFRAAKSDMQSWQEFDIESNDEPEIIEAVGLSDDRVLCITSDNYQGARLVTTSGSSLLTPALSKSCSGACVLNDQPVVAIEEASGATKLACYSGTEWSYINVPELFTKLMVY
jgi:hypothetical protein